MTPLPPELLELPRYRCHKVVRAAKIISIEGTNLILEMDIASGEGPTVTNFRVRMPPNWFLKHEPKEDGYIVVYDDQYASYSPAEAFEHGYAPIGTGLPSHCSCGALLMGGATVHRSGCWVSKLIEETFPASLLARRPDA